MSLLDLKVLCHTEQDCTLAFMYRDVPVFFKVPHDMTVGELMRHYQKVRAGYIREHHSSSDEVEPVPVGHMAINLDVVARMVCDQVNLEAEAAEFHRLNPNKSLYWSV